MADRRRDDWEFRTQAIAEFCQRWQIIEFSVFGSILRSDFRRDRDIDVLVNRS